MSCCPPGSEPYLPPEEGDTQGVVERWGDMDVYLTGPPAASSSVLVFYDVFGFNGGRIRSICDRFGAEGHRVVLPDFFRGDHILDLSNALEFVKKFPLSQIEKDTKFVLERLSATSVDKVGCVGFCWGAVGVFSSCSSDFNYSLVKCGVCFHPSLRLLPILNAGSEEDLAKRVIQPITMMPAGNDPDNVQPNGSIVTQLAAACPDSECHPYPDMMHGWMTRGDYSQPGVKPAVASAMQKSIKFLARFLK